MRRERNRSCKLVMAWVCIPALWAAIALSSCGIARGAEERSTVLGVKGTRFTLNGDPVFLLGFSYYGALGAPESFVLQDLDVLQRRGFNWLRVWATWGSFDNDVSAVDT